MVNKIEMPLVRYDESNSNQEALKGRYGQKGIDDATFTIIKNLLFVNLHKNAMLYDIELPYEVYDGFITLSNGRKIEVNDSKMTVVLDANTTGFGILVLKKWN